jgi:hypothetical protein
MDELVKEVSSSELETLSEAAQPEGGERELKVLRIDEAAAATLTG